MDLGELANEPRELWLFAELANVACGGHAGDPPSMRKACERALEHGVQLGAHPSYPDRKNFGRLSLSLAPSDVRTTVRRQCEALLNEARAAGAAVVHMKPHGALYHDATQHATIAQAVIDGAIDALHAPVIVGPPGSQLLRLAHAANLNTLAEGFADRAYQPDGTLVPRSARNALITNARDAAAQALRLAQTNLYQTLCLHSDTPGAPEIARAVREALKR